jgi:hypothetical protein
MKGVVIGSDTSLSVMGEAAEVQHAASLFLRLDQGSEQASCSSGVQGIFPMFYDAD